MGNCTINQNPEVNTHPEVSLPLSIQDERDIEAAILPRIEKIIVRDPDLAELKKILPVIFEEESRLEESIRTLSDVDLMRFTLFDDFLLNTNEPKEDSELNEFMNNKPDIKHLAKSNTGALVRIYKKMLNSSQLDSLSTSASEISTRSSVSNSVIVKKCIGSQPVGDDSDEPCEY